MTFEMKRPTVFPDTKIPVQAMQTFHIAAPIETHYRVVTCAQAECGAHQRGWVSSIDDTTPLGQAQAGYIRARSERVFTEDRAEDGTLMFIFPPGQRCFTEHRVSLEREPVFLVRGGDHRGTVGVPRFFNSGEAWRDALATDLDRLRTIKERG